MFISNFYLHTLSSLSAQAAAVCRSGYISLLPAPTARPIHVSRGRKDAGPGVHFVSPGLLQLTVLRHHRGSDSDEPVAVCLECRCTFSVGALGVTTISRQWRQCYIQELHSVRRRVDFKMATLVYLSLPGMVPAYVPLTASCMVSDEGRRQLRSATSRTCVVRRTYNNYGERCFAAAVSKLWNSLPAELRQTDISFQRFKRLLKTFLFGCWDRGALWLTVKAALISFLAYLLTLTQHFYNPRERGHNHSIYTRAQYCGHNFVLIEKNSQLNHRHYIIRQLYKYSYWLYV